MLSSCPQAVAVASVQEMWSTMAACHKDSGASTGTQTSYNKQGT